MVKKGEPFDISCGCYTLRYIIKRYIFSHQVKEFIMNKRLLLGILLVLPAGIFAAIDNPYADKPQVELMKDFLDTTKHPDKPWSWWIKLLVLKLRGNQKYKTFLKEFIPAGKKRNVRSVGLAFINHKKTFDPEVVKILTKMGINNVRRILEIRMKKK